MKTSSKYRIGVREKLKNEFTFLKTKTTGVRRVFEYNGSFPNAPVIINYDGSVQIGTSTPVTNARLSVYESHIQSGSMKPTVSPGPGIGVGGTATLSFATDVAGRLSIDLGSSGWTSGIIVNVSFNKTYAVAPIIVITPSNLNAADAVLQQRIYIASNTAGFSMVFGTAANTGNILTFNYHVIETVSN